MGLKIPAWCLYIITNKKMRSSCSLLTTLQGEKADLILQIYSESSGSQHLLHTDVFPCFICWGITGFSKEELKSLPCLTSFWFCHSRAGFFGTIVEYGAERKISRHSILGATVSVGVPQGVSLKIKSVQYYNSRLQGLTITCIILFPIFRWEGPSLRAIQVYWYITMRGCSCPHL